MKKIFNQTGIIHTLPLLVIVAAVGVISFLLISSTFPLNGLFGVINPKPDSHAATSPGTMTAMLNWSTPKISGAGLVVDPLRPSDYYMFYETPGGNVGTNHVLKSINYGQSWAQVDQNTFNGNAWGIAIDPNPMRNQNTPPTMYAPAGYGDMGLWKSTDGGAHWSNLFNSSAYQTCNIPKKGGGTVAIPRDTNNGCMDFYQVNILPDDPPNHIIVTYHYGMGQLLESTDGGATWVVHKIPTGTSHYVMAVTATTWISISQDFNDGIYRTTTAGRDGNGNISPSAWTKTTQDGNPSNFYHLHGNFTPYVDFNGDIYFAGGGGVVCSSNNGGNWHLVLDGNAHSVVGTSSYLYAFVGNTTWRLPKSCNATTIDHNVYPNINSSLPATWTSNIAPYGIGVSNNGTNWIMNFVTYDGGPAGNGEIWRFVETPPSTTPNTALIYDNMSGNLANNWVDCSSPDEYTHYIMTGMGGTGIFTLHSGTWPNGFLGLCNLTGVSTNNFSGLDFPILADPGNAGADVNISFRTAAGQTVTKPIDQYILGGDTKLVANKWEHITVPFSSLGLPASSTINRISFVGTSATQSILFMDEIDLIPTSGSSPIPSISPAASPTPVPTPTKTPTPAPSTTPGTKVGDLDNDGDVDIFDYSTLVTNFGRTGTNIPGDLDHDGDVDIFDYSALVTNFGH